ncbi:MAG: DNA repair protein RadC [Bacteroidota bacterium]|nr:DNA repair protein RadC [Bacteroidota bacterium]
MAEYKNLSIKDWSLEDRPREKLLQKGIATLSDAELIAIIIGSGNRDESAVGLSKRILSSVNHNLNELGKLTIDDLQKHKGIGEAKAISIVSALELGRRRKHSEIIDKQKITTSREVFEVFHPLLADLPHEEFWIILLNRSNKIIEKLRVSQGGISGTVTDVRLIMKTGLEKLASALILCHNHPSGNTKPSDADISITQKIKEAGTIMDITLLDHIIITDGCYYSFADNGLL